MLKSKVASFCRNPMLKAMPFTLGNAKKGTSGKRAMPTSLKGSGARFASIVIDITNLKNKHLMKSKRSLEREEGFFSLMNIKVLTGILAFNAVVEMFGPQEALPSKEVHGAPYVQEKRPQKRKGQRSKTFKKFVLKKAVSSSQMSILVVVTGSLLNAKKVISGKYFL